MLGGDEDAAAAAAASDSGELAVVVVVEDENVSGDDEVGDGCSECNADGGGVMAWIP